MKNRILLIGFLFTFIFSNAQTPPWTWSKKAGGNHWDEGTCISTDANGNIFIAGLFTSSSINFGNDTFATAGGNDIFLCKYDSAGNAVWAINAGGMADDVAYGISTDTYGNVIVCGSFASDTISIGPYYL